MAVMEPPFTLETATDEYDIRKYGPLLVAESRVEAGFDEAGTRGFKLLARYISGDNQSRTKVAGPSFESQHAPSETIAMTAPVCQEQSPWGFMIQFAMPASFTLATLPKPDDPRVQLARSRRAGWPCTGIPAAGPRACIKSTAKRSSRP